MRKRVVAAAVLGALAAAVALVALLPATPLDVHGVRLEAPRALALLAAIPLLLVAQAVTLSDFAALQQALGFAARALFVAVLALVLARPVRTEPRRAACVVALVDVSDSVADAGLDEARAYVESLRRAAAASGVPSTLRLVVFAGRPHVVPIPDGGPLPSLPRATAFGERGDATDIAAALRLARALAPPDASTRAVLVSDGNATTGDALAEAAAARRAGLAVDVRPCANAAADEVLVREVRPATAAKDLRVGAPFDLEAELYASRAIAATLVLSRDDAPIARRPVSLVAGRNVVTFRAAAPQPGVTTFAVAVTGLPGDFHDRFAANDRAVTAVALAGPPQLLLVDGDPATALDAERALAAQGLHVDVRAPEGLPSTTRELAHFDLVILSDVAAGRVAASQQAALQHYVEDDGGGLLFAGGENAFGEGGWSGTKLEQLLPVRFDAERRRDIPSLALILAVDRSGSMRGEKIELAKEAAKASAALLGPADLIGVIAFDAQPEAIVPLERASNRARIASEIARLVAGGGTRFAPPLEMAHEQLAAAKAKVKHVILLTDGQAEETDYQEVESRVERMVSDKITLSAVGVGAGADKTALATMAERGGGRFYFTDDASSVPRIFTKETTEVARSALVEQPVRARVARASEILAGVDVDAAPPLRGRASVLARPLAETLLTTDGGEPLLVRGRAGLGQTAVWASDVKARWAVDWLRWPGFARLLAQLARATMRHRALVGGAAGYALTTEVDPPRLHVAVDAVGPDDRWVDGLDTTVELHPADPAALAGPTLDERGIGAPVARTAMQQTAPGRYEADLVLDRFGAFLVRATHRRDGRVIAESTGTVAVPYPREYLALPVDLAALQQIAAAGGGSVGADAAGELAVARPVPTPHPLRAGLLLLAMVLLVVDVLLRRIPLVRRPLTR